MAILSKVPKPDNFESQNPLRLSFTNIQGLYSDCIECLSILESNSLDIFALSETNLDDSIIVNSLAVFIEVNTFFCMKFIFRKPREFLFMF